MCFIEKEITTNKHLREKFFKGSKEFFDYLSSYRVDLKSVTFTMLFRACSVWEVRQVHLSVLKKVTRFSVSKNVLSYNSFRLDLFERERVLGHY